MEKAGDKTIAGAFAAAATPMSENDEAGRLLRNDQVAHKGQPVDRYFQVCFVKVRQSSSHSSLLSLK
jgi:hypothetical protein